MADSNLRLRAEHTFPLRTLPLMLGLALGAFAAQAQTASTLKETVVSASRSEQDKDDLAVTVEVINRAEMEEKQMRDLRDVARDIPNVSVKRSPMRFTLAGTAPVGRDGDSGFNIRGMEGNRVLMLSDGIRTPRSYAFAANTFGRDYFDLGLIERIEVVKGPASALYGSDGVAGLVNFISATPADLIAPGATLGGRASMGYSGDDKSVAVGASIAGKASDSVQWLLAANTRRAEGLSNKGSNDTASTLRTTPNPQTDRTESFMGKLVVQASPDFKHVLTVEHVASQTDATLLSSYAVPPLAASSIIGQTAFSSAKRDRLSWDLTQRSNSALADSLKYVASVQTAKSRQYTFEDRNTSADRSRDVIYEEGTTQLALQADKVIRMGGDWAQKITYGVDYVVARLSNLQTGLTPPAGETFPLKRFPDTTETTSALYLQDEIIGGAWSITPGVRFDSFDLDASQAGFYPPAKKPAASLSGNAVSPKLGVLFRATPQWSVFGNYASGFKAPNAFQVNNFFQNTAQFAGFNYESIPNPNLKPESSQNFELGLRGRLGAVSLDVSAFDSAYNDFIEDNRCVANCDFSNPAATTTYQSVNINKARISGFEIKADWAIGKFGDGELSSSLAYGQTRGRDENSGKPINSIDPAKLNLGLKYRTGAFDLRMDVTQYAAKDAADIDASNVVVQFPTPAATVLDVSGQWRIRKNLRLNAGIYNLTDEKYWRWSEVRGAAAAPTANPPAPLATIDAYTQSGRYGQISLAVDF